MVSTVHFRVPRPVWREGLLIFIPALALYLMKGQPSLTAGPQAPVKALSQKLSCTRDFIYSLWLQRAYCRITRAQVSGAWVAAREKDRTWWEQDVLQGPALLLPTLCDRGNPSDLLLPYKEQQCSFKIITNKDSLGKHLGRGTLYALTNDCHHTAWLSCVYAPKWTQG